MKKGIIVSFLFISLFFGIGSVNAESILWSDNYKTSSSVFFGNCSSKDNCGDLKPASFYNENNFSFYMSPISYQTVSNSSGIGITLRSDEGFVKGNYYTVIIYVSLAGSDVKPTAITTNTKQAGTGYSEYNAISNASTSSKMTTNNINLFSARAGSQFSASNVAALSYTFVAKETGNFFFASFTTQSTITSKWFFYGYNYTNHGSKAPTPEEIKQSLQGNFTEVNTNINELKDKQDETNQKMDEFLDSDISEEDKQLPDDTSYQDYNKSEDALKDKMNKADMSKLQLGIDHESSNFVWDTLTKFIKANNLVFSMFISILTIGIIKLALGR